MPPPNSGVRDQQRDLISDTVLPFTTTAAKQTSHTNKSPEYFLSATHADLSTWSYLSLLYPMALTHLGLQSRYGDKLTWDLSGFAPKTGLRYCKGFTTAATLCFSLYAVSRVTPHLHSEKIPRKVWGLRSRTTYNTGV